MQMRKIVTPVLLSVFALTGFAQTAPQAYDKELNLLPRDVRTTEKELILRQPSTGGTRESVLNYYWINFNNAVDLAYNGLTLENISAVPLWPDSTVKVIGNDAGTPFEYFWWIHSFESYLDPTSEFFHDYVDYTYYPDAPPAIPTEEWFDNKHAYDVDSVGFYYYYDRYNTGVTDTLFVYVTTPGSSAHIFSTLGDPPFQAAYMRYIDDFNRPNGTYQEYMVLLGNEDSASFVPGYVSIPLDIEIPKDASGNDNKIGIAFSYHPGQAYAFGDTLLDFNDPPLVTNPLNTFWIITNEENFESEATSMEDGAYNQSGVATSDVRYNMSTTGWNGYYINTFAFFEPWSWDHVYVDWYLAPKGAAFLATPMFPCVDLTMEFFDFSNFFDAGTASYYWAFGDGGISLEANPTHTFPNPGTYEVCQVVTADAVSYEVCKDVTVDFCTGISDITTLSNLVMYPNPADEAIQIQVSFSEAENISFQVLNSQGQMVFSQNAGFSSNFNTNIDVSNWSAGLYLLQINNGIQSSTRTFIVE